MANTYCTLAQLAAYINVNVANPSMLQSGSVTSSQALQQQLLDDQAAYMESRLSGIYGPPFPLVDPTTLAAPIVCRRYVGISTVPFILGSQLGEFKVLAILWRSVEEWLTHVTQYQASIPNVNRLSTAKPALVQSANMTGGEAEDILPFMNGTGFLTRTPGASSPTWVGSTAGYTPPRQGGIGS